MIDSDEAFYAVWQEIHRIRTNYPNVSVVLPDEVMDTVEWAALRHSRRAALIELHGTDQPVTLHIIGDGGWWSKNCPSMTVALEEAYLLKDTDEAPDRIEDAKGNVLADGDAIEDAMDEHKADWNKMREAFNDGKPKNRQIRSWLW